MVDFSLGYDVSGEHYGLGVGLSKPPDCFTVREHREGGSYIKTDYVPKRTCHKMPGKMHYGERRPKCSECGYSLGDSRWNFCPKCGAEVVDGD